MKRHHLISASLLLCTGLLVAACSALGPDALERARSALQAGLNTLSHPAPATDLVASGTIEAPTVAVGSPLGGRIRRLAVAKGQRVQAGDLIAELDTALLDAEIAQAEANLAAARAQVAQLAAGARAADLDVAHAAIRQAEAGAAATRVAWQDALALLDAPSDLDVRIATAEAGVRAAAEQLRAAESAAAAADLEMQLWGRTVKSLEEGFNVTLPPILGGGSRHVDAPADKLAEARLQWNLASQRAWEAHARVETARASLAAGRQALADLRNQKANPQTLQAQADAARAAYDVAEAAVGVARANLAVLQAGAPAEQIAAAQALAERAAAALAALQARRQEAKIVAPQAGTVTEIVLHEGEVAAPGGAIVHLARLDEATLTVYVPEPDMGRVTVGQQVAVWVDSFPDRHFEGTIVRVADRAEFTPKNVQTREERADTVFPVKIALANSEGLLKPGMPADAQLSNGAGPTPTGLWLFGARWALPTPEPLAATRSAGTIEASEVAVAAEMGGRVLRVAVAEGEQVEAGQVLVELDAGEWQARRDEAAAAVAAARAELARLLATPQPERVAQAEAQVAQARATLAAAQTALSHARAVRANPQELDAQINAARSQVATAAAQVEVAAAQLKAARVQQESIPPNTGSDQDRTRRAIYDQSVAAAEALVRAAEATQQGAQASLAVLLQMRQQPIALDAAVHRAEGSVAQAEAAVGVAEAALAQLKAPPAAEAVAAAQARVAQAEAGLAAANVALEKCTVRSPTAGVVTTQAIHAGEVATPGTPLLTVTDMRRPKLVIYVPTHQIGQVRLGQAATVAVDAYPNRTFTGTVVRIADQAQFTPKNVQTAEERVRTVFAVELSLENEQGLLRPGMPAEATLQGR